jgi:hypothetical protein
MTENELELLDGLRALAAAEPQVASPQVERMLVAQFRARTARKRLVVWGSSAAGFGAVAAMIALMVWTPVVKAPAHVAPAASALAPGVEEAAAEPESEYPAAAQARYAVVRADDLASNFYPLPEAADLPAIETAMVVRVQMPASSLQLMGVPVSDDMEAGPVEADFLLGQDGLARGVRLIQQ